MISLSGILSFFTGGAFKSIASELNDAYQAKLNAANDEQRIAADVAIAKANARVAAQTQGAGSFWAKVMRAGFAIPFILYNGKLIIWDKMLGWGTTDPLSPYLETVGWMVIGFYFLDNTVRFMKR